MKAAIYSNLDLIGYSDLQVGDETMGHIYGEFIPTDAYYEKIQKSVWQFWSDGRTDYHKWHSLRFNFQLENGFYLFASGGCTIDDNTELTSEPLRVDITGVRNEVIKDFIGTVPARPFVDSPWEAIVIEQKLFFENQLRKELPAAHSLKNVQCNALCRSLRNDDVLFEASNGRFVLVHLTYNTNIDDKWPTTTFFNSFDEFKYKKMYPDVREWES